MLAFMGQGDSCPLSAAVVCHPGLNSLSDVKACKIPTSWVVAEVDTFFPPNRANEVEAILKEKGIPYEIRHYPGGFVISVADSRYRSWLWCSSELGRGDGQKGFRRCF